MKNFPTTENEFRKLYKTSARSTIEASEIVGCYYCLEIFPAKQVIYLSKGKKVGFCPFCEIDCLVPDISGYALTKEFLTAVRNHAFPWF